MRFQVFEHEEGFLTSTSIKTEELRDWSDFPNIWVESMRDNGSVQQSGLISKATRIVQDYRIIMQSQFSSCRCRSAFRSWYQIPGLTANEVDEPRHYPALINWLTGEFHTLMFLEACGSFHPTRILFSHPMFPVRELLSRAMSYVVGR